MSLSSVVHVVDDDASFRTAIRRRLGLARYEVVTYASAEQLLDQRPDESQQGCILLDVRIPGLSGPELQRRLGELGSTLPIIFVSAYADINTTVRTTKAGAEEAARKRNSTLDILRDRIGSLTPRERQVFERIVRGKTNKEIANELASTVRTVNAHRHRLMKQMMVHSVAELVSVSERFGLLAPNG